MTCRICCRCHCRCLCLRQRRVPADYVKCRKPQEKVFVSATVVYLYLYLRTANASAKYLRSVPICCDLLSLFAAFRARSVVSTNLFCIYCNWALDASVRYLARVLVCFHLIACHSCSYTLCVCVSKYWITSQENAWQVKTKKSEN